MSTALSIGVVGLGRAFTLMLPCFSQDPRIKLVAACDPYAPARDRFATRFNATAYTSAQQLCADPLVELVYIASPHELHFEHVMLAAKYGKHILLEKPLAISLAQGEQMLQACNNAGVILLVGHSHSMNTPIRYTRELIASGEFGALRLLHGLQYTDFMYRARRKEELDDALGGGVVFSQAAHQLDIARYLAGGKATSVMAHCGQWDSTRTSIGAYTALLRFEDGVGANCTYSGYGHFDSDTLMGNISELGLVKNTSTSGIAKAKLSAAGANSEVETKRQRGFAHYEDLEKTPAAHQHFGHWVISCELADLRPTPQGIHIDGDSGSRFISLPAPSIARQEVADQLWNVLREHHAATHHGAWALATLEACIGMLESSRTGQPIALTRQAPL
jgi:phthalate 4,5-cis-dihydrodiol dehydrogenase